MANIELSLTPLEARVLFNTIDGAADAGACAGGNTKQEAGALQRMSGKLLAQRDKWKMVKLTDG